MGRGDGKRAMDGRRRRRGRRGARARTGRGRRGTVGRSKDLLQEGKESCLYPSAYKHHVVELPLPESSPSMATLYPSCCSFIACYKVLSFMRRPLTEIMVVCQFEGRRRGRVSKRVRSTEKGGGDERKGEQKKQ